MAVQRDKVIASAEKLVAKGKIEPAIKEYERLLDDNPNDVNTLNRIGDLWVRINRNDEAVKVFAKIADHYSRDGFFLKAIAIFKKINKLDPSRLDIYAKLADLYAKQGLAMEAKSQYQVLADYYLKHGDPGNALTIYRKISELDPSSINVHVKLADLYSQNNQTAEALKEYDRVGRMLLKRGMLDEAVQVFRKALKIDSSNVELAESLITALIEAKDYNNAIQIVQGALETAPDNARLLALLGRIYLAKGEGALALQHLERGLAQKPNDPAIRETLADLYLRQNRTDRALEMFAPIADAAVAKGDGRAAVEMLNRVLRVDSSHAPTLERLVAIYVRLNEETNVLAAMNSLAEAHVASGMYAEAANVLEKLIQREPQNAQHRNKLAFVRQQTGGSDTIPARQKTAHDIPLMEIEEPPPALDYEEPELDLDASSGVDLDLGSYSAPPAAAPAPTPSAKPSPIASVPVAAPPPRIDTPLATIADSDEGSDDLDFITEHLTEAEVFAKYGLAEKAAEHLRAVIERAPKNLTAHEKLFRILFDDGDIDAARPAANQYIAVLEEKGERAIAEAVRQEFAQHGHSLAAPVKPTAAARTPTIERPVPAAARPAPAPTPAPPLPAPAMDASELADDEMSFDLDSGAPEIALDQDLDSMSFDIEEPATFTPEPAATRPPTMERPIPSIPMLPPLEDEPSISFDDAGSDALVDTTSFGEIDSFSTEETSLSLDPLPEPAAGDEMFFGVEALAHDTADDNSEPAIEEIGEIDFYIEQELFDEAQQKLDTLLARHPGNAELEKRRDRLAAAQTPEASSPLIPLSMPSFQPSPSQAFSGAVTLSPDEIENELLSAIPDDDDDFGIVTPPAPAPPPAAKAAAPPPAAAAREENLFSDEDDFFDLAAELESELAEDDEPISLSEEEQSLEEIFKEFKKGVEQQLDSEDYDTHYNLGIAYKEMGLIDEAIGEFQLASKDPKRAVECSSMLGLCFLEKGMPQLAIKWYRKGLEMPEITEEEHLGLLYDLGSAYLEVGDTDNAQKAFTEVYGLNTNYRDIVGRLKQLEDPGAPALV